MRTTDEIVARIKEVAKEEFFGFESSDLIMVLPWDEAKKFLKEESHEEEKKKWRTSPPTDDEIRAEAIDYLDFAFGKAINHRGLSAGRSVSHLRAWCWLLGEDELVAFIDDEDNYPNYGAPILKKVAEHWGVDVPDNPTFQAMARGDKCPSCQSGDSGGCGE